MQTSTVDSHAVENFLRLAKGSTNKEDFLSRVREFDQKFIDSYPSPVMTPLPQIPKSSPMQAPQRPVQPLKNPFVSGGEEKNRQFQRATPSYSQQQYNQGRRTSGIPYSRSETNFYVNEGSPNTSQNLQANFYGDLPYQSQQQLQHPQFQGPQFVSYGQQNYPPRPQKSLSQLSQVPPSPYEPQQNEFISNYQQDPQFIKYFKKMVPNPNNFNNGNNGNNGNNLNNLNNASPKMFNNYNNRNNPFRQF